MNFTRNRINLFVLIAALFLPPTAGMACSSPAPSPQRGAAWDANQREEKQPPQSATTFTGEITENPNTDASPAHKYLFYDEWSNANFFLSDEKELPQYDGKVVELKGALDRDDNTIQVQSIMGVPPTFLSVGK